MQVRGVATNFYRGLMTVVPLTEDDSHYKELVWAHMRSVVIEHMHSISQVPFIGDELTRVLMTLPHGSCIGENELSFYSYKRY